MNMNEKDELKPHYIEMCGNKVRECCHANPDCYKEIHVINGKPIETGLCCRY